MLPDSSALFSVAETLAPAVAAVDLVNVANLIAVRARAVPLPVFTLPPRSVSRSRSKTK